MTAIAAKFASWQTVLAAVLAFTIGAISQGYAIGSWKTQTDFRLTATEVGLSRIVDIVSDTHDEAIKLGAQMGAANARLDRIATALSDLKTKLAEKGALTR